MIGCRISVLFFVLASAGFKLVLAGKTAADSTTKRVVYVHRRSPAELEFSMYQTLGFVPLRLELRDSSSQKRLACDLRMARNKYVCSMTRPTQLNDQFIANLWYTNGFEALSERNVTFSYRVTEHSLDAILVSIDIGDHQWPTHTGTGTGLPSTTDDEASTETATDKWDLCWETAYYADDSSKDDIIDLAISLGNIQKKRLIINGVKNIRSVLGNPIDAVHLLRQYIVCDLHLRHLSYEILQAIYVRSDELLFEMSTTKATLEVLVMANKVKDVTKVSVETTEEDFFDVSLHQRFGERKVH